MDGSDQSLVMSGVATEAMRQHFHVFDEDANGFVERSELGSVLQVLDRARWSDTRVDALMAAMDENMDGKISLDEFLKWVFKEGDEQKAVGDQIEGSIASVPEDLVTFLASSGFIKLAPPMQQGFMESFHKTSYGRRFIVYSQRCAEHEDGKSLAINLGNVMKGDEALRTLLRYIVEVGRARSSVWMKCALQLKSMPEVAEVLAWPF
eukprot:TRINITY_DN66899_c0_g1_i1.p2 TRINITY_DN66899_c0_g1~~TRINITY_DN66899_c0_g1_i1.p2  ORF type:complete len:207 (-),score=52.07 TRINITY_DN66899_c0_g1_i1:71-691(-)